jgi:ribonuclease BN (tRNA processing enzyme)
MTARYGGNTSCVELSTGRAEHRVVLDAGSGIRPLGDALPRDVTRLDLLLTHVHMDHILGLGFFAPLFRSDIEVHMWGPRSTTLDLRERLARYLSPPLFPVRLRDLPSRPVLHDVPLGPFELPGLRVTAELVCHPGPTVGYRIDDGSRRVAYLPDHEPALGVRDFPEAPRWTSGHALARGVDVLVHDAQFDDADYPAHQGWGHSSISHTLAFAAAAGVGHLVPFHHDPDHDDDHLDARYRALEHAGHPFAITPAREGASIDVDDLDAGGRDAARDRRRGQAPGGSR